MSFCVECNIIASESKQIKMQDIKRFNGIKTNEYEKRSEFVETESMKKNE